MVKQSKQKVHDDLFFAILTIYLYFHRFRLETVLEEYAKSTLSTVWKVSLNMLI